VEAFKPILQAQSNLHMWCPLLYLTSSLAFPAVGFTAAQLHICRVCATRSCSIRIAVPEEVTNSQFSMSLVRYHMTEMRSITVMNVACCLRLSTTNIRWISWKTLGLSFLGC
jgi:hypothetical protein